MSDRPVRVLPHLYILLSPGINGHFSTIRGRRKICNIIHTRGAGQYS